MVEFTFPMLVAIEPFVEILNGLLSIIIIIMGVIIFKNHQGELKTAWNYFLLAILLFGFHEIIGVLRAFDIFVISGFYDLTELFFIVAFLVSIFIFRKVLKDTSEVYKE